MAWFSGLRGGGASSRPEGVPLTREEIEAVQRMMSDPTAFPAVFKNWLTKYLEANPPIIPLSQVFGIGGVIPPGVVWAYAGATIPETWLSCNGQSVSTLDYPELFKAIGYTFGGSGNTFGVPDIRGRMIVGLGANSDSDVIGESEGQSLADRRPRHHHYPQFGVVNSGGGGGFPAGGGSPNYPVTQVRIGELNPSAENTSGYIVLQFIIKT